MKYDSFKHSRRSIRLKSYDYSQAGAYFITTCAQNRECLFGSIAEGVMKLSPIGQTAYDFWQEIPRHFANVEIEEFVVMPNHIHGIIVIAHERVGVKRSIGVDGSVGVGVEYIQPLPNENIQPPPPQNIQPPPQRNEYQHVIPQSVGSIVRTYKAAVTRWCNENGNDHFRWQRNYYEHIVRNERELNAIRAYIQNNPIKWAADMDNLNNAPFRPPAKAIDDYLRDVGITGKIQ